MRLLGFPMSFAPNAIEENGMFALRPHKTLDETAADILKITRDPPKAGSEPKKRHCS